MKKQLSLFLAILLCPVLLMAQSPAGRAPKTIVADVLAKMPAQNIEVYNAQMNDLASQCSASITILTDMMGTPASEGNNQIEYALGGLSYFVTQPGKEATRQIATKAYIDALNKSKDRETKAFLIRQVQITGADDAVETLAKYAISADLYDEATRALVAIGSPKVKALIDGIVNVIPSKVTAAKAAGDLGVKEAEDDLLGWLNTGDAALQKAVINALGRIGGEASLAVLSDAVAENSFGYEPSGTLEAYFMVLSRQDLAKSEKTLAALLKNTCPNVRAAAISILSQKNSPLVMNAAIKALKDPSRPYRNSAIKAAAAQTSGQFLANPKVISAKISDEARTDLFNVIGDYRCKSLTTEVAKQIASSNEELQIAAMTALAKIATKESLTPLFAVFNGTDAKQIKNAQKVLEWAHYDVAPALTAALDNVSEMGKVAVVELLASRAASAAAPKLIALTTSGDNNIKNAAYSALKSVATEKELPALYQMLESAPADYIAPLQEAIGAAVATLTPDKALEIVAAKLNATVDSRKHLYYPVLSYTNSPKAFDIVAKGIVSNDANIKAAAAKSAVAWKGTEAIQTVYEVIANPQFKALQPQAVTNYIALVNGGKYNDQQKYLFIRKALEKTTTPAEQNALLSQLRPLNSFGALLTAAKYMNNDATKQAAGSAVMTIAQKDKTYANWSKEVENILKQFIATRTGGDAGYEKTAVQKYLDEAPSCDGYVKIFNEKDLSGWKGLVENPIARNKMTAQQLAEKQVKADEIMRTGWEVKDGILYFTGHGDNLCTNKKYGDFEMYVDWYIEPQGDAGVYLRGTPQVQVWDTSRVDVGAQVGSGGLYNNGKNPSQPTVLADNRIGDWNTFYIKMVGERVTVELNGIRVVDNVILENYWNRALPIFTEEQLELQAHGTIVGYRDVFVKELPKVDPIQLSAEEQKEGFKLLFDGVSMNQWIGNTKDYVAENGAIKLYPGNGGGGNLYTKDEYKDFVFRFDFKLTDAANNGLGIRTPLEGDAAYVGMELQILDNEHPVYKDLQVYQYHGSVYGVIPSKRGFLKPVGEWNTQEVYIKGNNIKITLNGTVILEGNIAEASKNGTADHKDHPGLKNEKGHIGFLGHGSVVEFKNIRIKELK